MVIGTPPRRTSTPLATLRSGRLSCPLPRRREADGRPELFEALELPGAPREQHRDLGAIKGKDAPIGGSEALEFGRVVGADPARRLDSRRLSKRDRHAVFVLDAGRPARRAAAGRRRRRSSRSRSSGGRPGSRPPRRGRSAPWRAAWPSSRRPRRTRRMISGAKFGMPVTSDRLAFGQRVADAQRAVVGDADDVAGHRLVGESRGPGRRRTSGWRRSARGRRRTLRSFMPRLNVPEHSRTKAMRSRWFGSMLAWTLNTKPVTASVGRHRSAGLGRLRARRRRPVGDRVEQLARRRRPCSAEPKNTGVMWPRAIGLEVEAGQRRPGDLQRSRSHAPKRLGRRISSGSSAEQRRHRRTPIGPGSPSGWTTAPSARSMQPRKSTAHADRPDHRA